MSSPSSITRLLVIAEQKDGVLNRASWEAIAAAQTTGQPVTVAVAGSKAHTAAVTAELASADVAEVIALEHDLLTVYTADGFTQAMCDLVKQVSPSHVVFAHTYQTRDYAPKLATRFGKTLISDVIAAQFDGGGPVFVRQLLDHSNVALFLNAPPY